MLANRSFWALGLAVVCALSLMGLPQAHKKAIAGHTRFGILATSQWFFSKVISFTRNAQKTRFLLTQNVELALDNMRLREAAWENVRLRRALEFRQQEETTDIIPAEVIGRDLEQLGATIVINAGDDRQIQNDWPVVTAEGLVGHVSQVGSNSSVVQLLIGSPVSALVQERRTQGIVSWVNGNRFQLRFVEASSIVEKGDRVISSGLGGRYPKGIPIGVLVEVRGQEETLPVPLLEEVYLESNVDFLKLEEVFVVKMDFR